MPRTAEPSSGECRCPLQIDSHAWQVIVQTLHLSPQQARIVESLLRGCRDKQIAEDLGLTVPTVRTYLSRVFLRAGVADRVELILLVFALVLEHQRHQNR